MTPEPNGQPTRAPAPISLTAGAALVLYVGAFFVFGYVGGSAFLRGNDADDSAHVRGPDSPRPSAAPAAPRETRPAVPPLPKETHTPGTAEQSSLTGSVVCIDPGHPSETSSGKVVQNGTTENHINWVVAQKLRSALVSQGAKVVMTKRAEDEYVTNRQRAEAANAAHADLMVRLHCDTGGGTGVTTYYPDRAGRHPKYKVTGPPARVIAASGRLAATFHPALAGKLAPYVRDNGIKGDSQTAVGRKQGALTGSIFVRVPVVTVEMCFLSNPKDATFIKSEQGQSAMARALAHGIRAYLGNQPGKRR